MDDVREIVPPGPPKDPTFGKAQILLTVAPDLKRLVQERAARHGMSMGAYARQVLGVHLGLIKSAALPQTPPSPGAAA